MSKTVRISDGLYEAIDEYRDKDQTFQDIIEMLATEAGLYPSKIRGADDLEKKLQVEYGFETNEVRQVLEALRYIYTAQEKENSIGVPHAAADNRYQDEIDTLKRLNLVQEKHYTGKYDYGYRTTTLGKEIGSELVRDLLTENAREIEEVFAKFNDALLSVLIKFGFEKTDTDHLSDRGAILARYSAPEFWDISELKLQYGNLKDKLVEVGIAARYSVDGTRFVLPPEFQDFLKQRTNTKFRATMQQIEVYQIVFDYTREELQTRDDILKHLDTATESDLEQIVEDFYQQGLTSRYVSNRDTPFLVKDGNGVREQVEQEVKQILKIS